MEKTTIQITTDTLERLRMFKPHEKDSHDTVINILLNDFQEDVLSDEEIKEIQESLEEVKKGEVFPIEEVAKEIGVSLE